MVFSLEKAPHLVGKRTTKGIMLDLTSVLLAVFVYSMIWYFVNAGADYGVKAILILIVSLVSSVGADALFALPLLFDKKVESVKERFKAFGKKILLSYGYVSGLIFALLLPIGTPYYVVFVGSFIGTLLAKDIFGGFGTNIFNPAIVGRVFVQVCFPSQLVSYLGAVAPETVSTGATIMGTTSSLGWTTNFNGISLLDMFLGDYRGTLGEPFAFILILAGIYLIVRKVIDWRLPVFYFVSFLLMTLFMGFCSGLGVHSFEFAIRNLFMGGVLFGGIFCLTDPVTAPTSRAGKCIYAVSAALFTGLIRYQANASEGVAYAILLVNMLAPLMTRFLKAKSNQKLAIKGSVIGGIAVVGIIFGCVYGASNKTSDVYSSQISRYDEDVNVYNLVMKTAKTNASNYLKVPATMDEDYGTIVKKVNFTMDDKAASYYELKTNPSLLYKKSTEETTYYIDFAIVVNSEGTVGYQYLSGTEDAKGITFAKQFIVSQTHPYLNQELGDGDDDDAAFFDQELVTSSATDGNFSTKTISAITTAIQGAETEYGLTVTPEEPDTPSGTADVTNLNAILTAQSLTNVTSSDVTEATVPIFTNANVVGTCTQKLTGFQVNSKSATYYEVKTPTVPITFDGEQEDVTVTLGMIINSDGVVGLKAINLTIGLGQTNVSKLVKAITISNPFKSTDTVGTFGSISFSGASEYTSVIVDKVMKACLTDFGGN